MVERKQRIGWQISNQLHTSWASASSFSSCDARHDSRSVSASPWMRDLVSDISLAIAWRWDSRSMNSCCRSAVCSYVCRIVYCEWNSRGRRVSQFTNSRVPTSSVAALTCGHSSIDIRLQRSWASRRSGSDLRRGNNSSPVVLSWSTAAMTPDWSARRA